MDILKASTDWAKAEVFSASFFIVFGIVFCIASFVFWQLGKTEIAKAYITSTLVVGCLLLTIGIGLFYANMKRITEFETAYKLNESAFVESERARAESTLKEYRTIVFKAIPLIIVACAIGILFLDAPAWRAGLISTIALMVVILLIDGTAHSRIETYNNHLKSVQLLGGD